MRMIPVKTKPASRRVWVRLLMWELNWRMKRLQNDIDVWFPVSAPPVNGSPWEATQLLADRLEHSGHSRIIHIATSEATMRLDAVEDHFFVLRAAMRTRRVHSLYAMCRATIEACAFASWVLDPDIGAAERLLRGLYLREDAMGWHLRSLQSIDGQPADGTELFSPGEVAQAIQESQEHLSELKQTIQSLHSARRREGGSAQVKPSKTGARVQEMLCDEMELPQGCNAYHQMSGVAHSQPTAIFGTWSAHGRKPSIDYANFLMHLHLALCSIEFSLGRRAGCWGKTPKNSGIHKIIGRLEHIIGGEAGVLLE